MAKKPKPMTLAELQARVKELDRLYLLADSLCTNIANASEPVAMDRLKARESIRRKRLRAWNAYRKLRDTPYTLPEKPK